MATMNVFRKSLEVKKLARQHALPESDVREMLAIESGVISGDVKEKWPPGRPAMLSWLSDSLGKILFAE